RLARRARLIPRYRPTPSCNRSRSVARVFSSESLPLERKELVMANPTIVLIHGAFGDASSWRPVFDRLVGDGHTVLAPPNPLRGVPFDASHTAAVIDELEGP